MEKLTSKGLIISPNVGAIPVSGQGDDSSKDVSEDSSPQSDSSSQITTATQTSTVDRKKDPKWSKRKLNNYLAQNYF